MLLKRVLFLSVFFRGFRGHNIRHHQIETVLGDAQQSLHGRAVFNQISQRVGIQYGIKGLCRLMKGTAQLARTFNTAFRCRL